MAVSPSLEHTLSREKLLQTSSAMQPLYRYRNPGSCLWENAYVVDDDDVSRYLTEVVLTEGEFSRHLTAFSSAGEALEEIAARERMGTDPFLVFLDLDMPVMSGWDFLLALSMRQDTIRDRCRVVILTASVDEENPDRARQYPMVLSLIAKPLRAEALASLTLLNQRHKL